MTETVEISQSMLKRKRGAIKAKVTTFGKRIKEIEQVLITDVSESIKSEKMTELQLRIEKIEPLLMEFEDIQVKVEESTQDFENELEERELFESEYYNQLAAAKNLLIKYTLECQERNTNRLSENENQDTQVNNKINIKLPQINLTQIKTNIYRCI